MTHGKTAEVVPLTMAPVGVPVTLVEIRGGRRIAQRLSDMGLVRGASFEVLRGAIHGPVIIRLMEGKVILGRGMAHAIHVKRA